MIELHQVSKTYGQGAARVVALDGVDVRLEAGEHVALTGPSGSGKSTMLHLIGLLDRPSQGTLHFEGRDTGGLSERERTMLRRQAIGFVFQQFHLLPFLTALENVLVPLVPQRASKDDRRRAQELLERVGLGDRLHHRPAELSGGEQQRVAVARALINRPRVLLADEPTGNLDAASAERLLELLTELHRDGLTLVVTTHNEQVAARAKRRVRLASGRLVS